ncbi:ribonuclease PH [Bartonella sp. DGB1]|uniref:ribonuclease PH n=1 Tax=Bartonella sp. DGB1 TaxID=3239807 RepID=UPI0035251DF8
MRLLNRACSEMRNISFERNIIKYAEGSCLVKFGDTQVICTATVEKNVPHFLKKSGKGWVTAEYNMLPRATNSRVKREAVTGKQSGRTLEIQRLIGRSLRAIMDLNALGEIQIIIDCDVIQADGGTRTAAITGAWVALYDAVNWLKENKLVNNNKIITDNIAAVSCGIYNGELLVDLDYTEDCNAQADINFVMTGNGGIVEIQGTAEKEPFTEDQFNKLSNLAKDAINKLIKLQNLAVQQI